MAHNCCQHTPSPSPKPSAANSKYTCPMHPEIVQETPGDCPICGMALEPLSITIEEEINPEYLDMRRRFWISLVLSAPLLFLTMSEMFFKWDIQKIFPGNILNYIQLIIATPVVLWGGWPFFKRGWLSIVRKSL